MPLSAKIYADSLISKGYGTPLWMVPSKVEIGDVGFIHESGTWVKLFNVLPDSNDIHSGVEMPEGFEPLVYDEDTFLHKSRKVLDPSILASVSIKQIGESANATM